MVRSTNPPFFPSHWFSRSVEVNEKNVKIVIEDIVTMGCDGRKQ
jgi:hypothetical protein